MTSFHFTPPDAGGIDIPAHLKSKTKLLTFLANAIPLPDYFGQNWDALEECLSDFDWLDRPRLVLIHHDIPLENAPTDQRLYLEILANTAAKSERLVVIFPEESRPHLTRIVSQPG